MEAIARQDMIEVEYSGGEVIIRQERSQDDVGVIIVNLENVELLIEAIKTVYQQGLGSTS